MNWLFWLAGSLGILVLLYVVACVVLARMFTGGAHATTWPLRATPADLGLAYEDIAFRAVDGLRIAGWWLPSGGETAVVMIPGGGGNRLSDSTLVSQVAMGYLVLARAFTSRGHSVLMYDPRGTGGSEGNRIGFGSLEARDLVGALDWLAERRVTPDRVAVFAHSMGCATAMFALDKRTYAGLVADSPLGGFSTDDVVRFASSLLRLPTTATRPLTLLFMNGVFVAARLLWGMRLSDQPMETLRAHPAPTLVFHGRADRRIPVRVGEQVAEAAGDGLLGAYFLDGVDHGGSYDADPAWYVATVTGALDSMFRGRVSAAAAAPS